MCPRFFEIGERLVLFVWIDPEQNNLYEYLLILQYNMFTSECNTSTADGLPYRHTLYTNKYDTVL